MLNADVLKIQTALFPHEFLPSHAHESNTIYVVPIKSDSEINGFLMRIVPWMIEQNAMIGVT